MKSEKETWRHGSERACPRDISDDSGAFRTYSIGTGANHSGIRRNFHSAKAGQRKFANKYVAFCGVIATVFICLVVVPLLIAAVPGNSEIKAVFSMSINMGNLADMDPVSPGASTASVVIGASDSLTIADANMITEDEAIERAFLWLESFDNDVDQSTFRVSTLLWASNPSPMYIPTWEVYLEADEGTRLWIPTYCGYDRETGEFVYNLTPEQKASFDLEGYLDYRGGRLDSRGRPCVPFTFSSARGVFMGGVVSISVNAYSGHVIGYGSGETRPPDENLLTEGHATEYAKLWLESYCNMLGLKEFDFDNVKTAAVLFMDDSPMKSALWEIAIEDNEERRFSDFHEYDRGGTGGTCFIVINIDGYSGDCLGYGYISGKTLEEWKSETLQWVKDTYNR